jgi:hypothetical protein
VLSIDPAQRPQGAACTLPRAGVGSGSASENTASTWRKYPPRSVPGRCPSKYPRDNFLHVSSGYPWYA